MTQPKCVGIVGPTNVPLMEEKAGLQPGTLERAAREIGVFLAGRSFGMVCVPIKGVPLWALEAYKQAGGKHSLALWPGLTDQFDPDTQTRPGNPELADEMRGDLTWGEEPFELAKLSDCLVSIGLSCGTMVEMIATKWIKRRPIFTVRPLMTGIPDEIAAELDIRYSDSVESLEQNIVETMGSPILDKQFGKRL